MYEIQRRERYDCTNFKNFRLVQRGIPTLEMAKAARVVYYDLIVDSATGTIILEDWLSGSTAEYPRRAIEWQRANPRAHSTTFEILARKIIDYDVEFTEAGPLSLEENIDWFCQQIQAPYFDGLVDLPRQPELERFVVAYINHQREMHHRGEIILTTRT